MMYHATTCSSVKQPLSLSLINLFANVHVFPAEDIDTDRLSLTTVSCHSKHPGNAHDDDDDFCYKRVQTPGMSPPRAGAWTYCLFTPAMRM